MSREFSNKLQTCSRRSARRFKNNQDGYIFILMCCLIPVILLGTKLVLDTQTEHASEIHIYKKCAREAALAVAKKWNPALTYYQQRFALLKIADDVYNASPAYNAVTSSAKYDAIPGLEIPTKIKVMKGGKYDPLKVAADSYETISLSPSSKTVKYTTGTSDYTRAYVLNPANCDYGSRSLEQMYHAVYFMEKSPYFVLEDTIKDCTVVRSGSSACRTYGTFRTLNKTSFATYASLSGSTTISGTFDKRADENDKTVQISVSNDRIKVQTDHDIAYATPATCNIDIVLGIPVNGAACNSDNRDARTATIGSSYYQTETTPQTAAQTTPIYQISQAFRSFVKNNFDYTRGSHIGLVPYSGNLSIPQDRIATWAEVYPSFITTNFNSDQNTYQAFFRPCYSYGIGRTTALSGGIYSSIYKGLGGCEYSGLNIMVRKGRYWTETTSGLNTIFAGDLLSTANPALTTISTYNYKFGYPSLRYIPYRNSINYLNFCFGYYRDGTTTTGSYESQYLVANPYHVAEITPDLLKVTDLLNCFYPFSHSGCSESNFIFLPVTWANNLFQSWTKDTKFDKADTTASTPSAINAGNSGRLSCPSKDTDGRKKAVIIVVNKPDWFESNEITYLGYDNDYSEVPMIESDAIDFSRDYSSTSGGHFADGLNYDGTIQGPKKVLKFTTTSGSVSYTSGAYRCTSATGKLEFPKKYLLQLKVAPISGSGTISFSNITSDSNTTTTGNHKIIGEREFFIEAKNITGGTEPYYITFTMNNLRLVSASITNRPYKVVQPNCSLIGTNIKTNVKKPMMVKVKLSALGTVTFSNVGNSNIDNSGSHTITGAQEFKFPSSNFDSNFTKTKIEYTLSNAKITVMTLKNQTYRLNFGSNYYNSNNGNKQKLDNVSYQATYSGEGPGTIYTFNNTIYWQSDEGLTVKSVNAIHDTGVWSWSTCNTEANILIECLMPISNCNLNITYAGSSSSKKPNLFLNYIIQNSTNSPSFSVRKELGSLIDSEINASLNISGTGSCTYIKVATDAISESNYWYSFGNVFLKNNQDISLSSVANNGIWIDNDNICFFGTGDLNLKVESLAKGTLTHTAPSGSSVSETFTSEQTITIDPDNYKYAENSDGTYTIQLTVDNVTLSDLKPVDSGYIVEWTKIRLPNESRTVNFLKNSGDNFVYSVCGQETTGSNSYILAGSSPNANKGDMDIRWNTTKACWEFYPREGNRSQSDHFWLRNYSGDMYLLADATDIHPTTEPYYDIWINPNSTGTTHKYEYFGTNLYRSFWKFQDYKRAPSTSSAFAYTFETYNTVLPLIYGGFTLPINAALFFGADGTTLHKYEFQANTSTKKWNGNDATTGVQNVTVAALKKLYSDWSSNIRIYVILFRKQTQYSHPITKAATNFKYDYITNLAANSSLTGTTAASAEYPIYKCIDVADEAGLNSTLSSIASELKTWAGYTEAKVVE